MWPFPRVRHEQICVSITPSDVTVGWIQPPAKNKLPVLKAYKKIAWDNSFKMLTDQLSGFVTVHKIAHSLMSVALSSPHIHERFVRLSTASPLIEDFFTSSLKKSLWDFRYLHTLDDGQSLFYLCGIERPHIFSQQLLAYRAQLHLINITSCYMALIESYRALYADAFRRSQLSIDLIKNDYEFSAIMNVENIHRLITIPSYIPLDCEEEKMNLLILIGLFNQERTPL